MAVFEFKSSMNKVNISKTYTRPKTNTTCKHRAFKCMRVVHSVGSRCIVGFGYAYFIA